MDLHRKLSSITLTCAIALLTAGASGAATISEIGDAGETLATAQMIASGDIALTEINGTIAMDTSDVDLFRIFISQPAEFSARTTNGDSTCSIEENPECGESEFDAYLALFDADGRGVYANDDRGFDEGDAELPAGDPLSPTEAGFYYLAISDEDSVALSFDSPSGVIFAMADFPFTDVVGPTGPGGADPLELWFKSNVVPDPRSYTIELTGVVVPEPGTAILMGLGLAVLGLDRRRAAWRGPIRAVFSPAGR